MNNKFAWLGAITGMVSGFVGAILISNWNFSILGIGIIGALIGLVLGFVYKKYLD